MWTDKTTYNVEGEVGVTAHMAGCILGTAVVQAIVVVAGALEDDGVLLVVDRSDGFFLSVYLGTTGGKWDWREGERESEEGMRKVSDWNVDSKSTEVK